MFQSFNKSFALKPILALVTLVVSGCATVVSGRFEEIHVTTYCGTQRVEASCQVSNENGEWNLRTPGKVTVQKGFGDLVLFCRGDSFEPHLMRLQSTTTATNFGNLLLGAGAGALVDVNNGAGYSYPEEVSFVVKSCNAPRNSYLD
jgi:hypothetical protein